MAFTLGAFLLPGNLQEQKCHTELKMLHSWCVEDSGARTIPHVCSLQLMPTTLPASPQSIY
eukprot:4227905-Amphidinium_carterae.1